MKEEKIGLELAKLSYELGLKLHSEDFYTENYGLCSIGYDGEFLNTKKDGTIYDCNGEFGEGFRYYAPTKSLLKDLLWDEFKIFVQVEIDCTSYPKFAVEIYEYIQPFEFNKVNQENWSLYRSPEEALEKGLLQALLILKEGK